MKLRCLIVDDEPVAQKILERYISELDTLELVGKCKTAVAAAEFLMNDSIDLLLLDIEMPKLTGIDLLNTLSNPPAVIITTAYREYALDGYELNVIDYLLKPISFERFIKAVNKVAQSRTGLTLPKPSLGANYIYIKSDKRMVQIYLNQILYIEGLSNYVRVALKNEKPLISYQKLSQMEKLLPSTDFVRCHRSYIVSLIHIRSYSATELEIEGNSIPIGASHKEVVMAILKSKEI